MMQPAYEPRKFAYCIPTHVYIQAIRKPDIPSLPAPTPKPKPMIAGIFANDCMYIASNDESYTRLSKQLPDPPCSVIRLKASQMSRVPVKSHFYGHGVIELPAPKRICIGSQVAIRGFSPYCTVTDIYEHTFQSSDDTDTWVKLTAQVGKHTQVRTVRLSALESQP